MNSLRILVADDDFLARVGLVAQLQQLGHQVVAEAADGDQAVKLAVQTRPDLVLLDIKMPKLDGIQVARLIMQRAPAAIVILSGYSEATLTNEAIEAGVQAYLVKPVTAREMAPTLALAQARFQQQAAAAGPAAYLPEADLQTQSPTLQRLIEKLMARPIEMRLLMVYRNRGLAWWEESDLIAFAGGEPEAVRAALRSLVEEKVLDTRVAAGLTFYNLSSDPTQRQPVEEFFAWSREARDRLDQWRDALHLGPDSNSRAQR